MPLFSLAFLLGVLSLQFFPHLPPLSWTVVIFLPFLFLRKPPLFITGWILGFLWCLFYATQQLAWQLPKTLEGKPMTIVGRIATIPENNPEESKFLLVLKEKTFFSPRIKLSWRGEHPTLHVGDVWRLQVKLKRIHSMRNPGGFDYEAWAFQENIRAQGTVITPEKNQWIKNSVWQHPIDHLRESIQQTINHSLPHSETSAWISALTIGERHHITAEQWEVLRNTGTNHLMAIAGLHIGFISGFAWALVAWCWRRTSFVLKIPAQQAGAIAALCVALFYSALSGFLLPAQRASIMFIIFLIALLCKRNMSAWFAWSAALLMILIFNPLSVLNSSFWLSLGCVASIIYGMAGRLAPHNLWWQWGRVQWVITIGLIPLSIVLFQQWSVISLLANSIAIPWMGFLILPFCFLGTVLLTILPTLGGFLLLCADKSLSFLWWILSALSHWQWASWYHAAPSLPMVLLGCLGVMMILVPIGFPGRYFGIIFLLPLCVVRADAPRAQDLWLTVLDVGQGLAVVAQTQHHVLVYDAGAKWNDAVDMGENVVVPYLRTLSVSRIDALVVSHADNDHSGGVWSLLKRFPVTMFYTSVPMLFPNSIAQYCLQGIRWQWDGVEFAFLYPNAQQLQLGNDSSCVLQIKTAQAIVILPGDIEKAGEKNLVTMLPMQNKTMGETILVAPHHGSNTSSTTIFLNRFHPTQVIFSTGYRNRYHFPSQKVIERYQQLQSKMFNTATQGAIQLQWNLRDRTNEIHLYRLEKQQYWNEE